MNGHHADCSCQSCAIGREIGMDRAIDLLFSVRTYLSSLNPEGGVCVMPKEHRIRSSIEQIDAFLAEHE